MFLFVGDFISTKKQRFDNISYTYYDLTAVYGRFGTIVWRSLRDQLIYADSLSLYLRKKDLND